MEPIVIDTCLGESAFQIQSLKIISAAQSPSQ